MIKLNILKNKSPTWLGTHTQSFLRFYESPFMTINIHTTLHFQMMWISWDIFLPKLFHLFTDYHTLSITPAASQLSPPPCCHSLPASKTKYLTNIWHIYSQLAFSRVFRPVALFLALIAHILPSSLPVFGSRLRSQQTARGVSSTGGWWGRDALPTLHQGGREKEWGRLSGGRSMAATSWTKSVLFKW